MYTSYTAPGMFSLADNGFGPAAAESSSFQVIGANNPAKPGDIPMLFVTGMGSVTPSLFDGVPSSPTGQPPNVLDIYNSSSLGVYFDGIESSNINFAGVVPGYAAGLYQINAQIPPGVSSGNDYLDILTPDAEAEQVTLDIASTSSAAVRGTVMRKPSGRGRLGTPGRPAIRQRVAPVSR
jgi:uncharacterized protein (TIGR03437 family)